MGLEFKCPACGEGIITQFVTKGEKVKCRSCGKSIPVPDDAIETDESPDYHKPIPESSTIFPDSVEDTPDSGKDFTVLRLYLVVLQAVAWVMVALFAILVITFFSMGRLFWSAFGLVSIGVGVTALILLLAHSDCIKVWLSIEENTKAMV